MRGFSQTSFGRLDATTQLDKQDEFETCLGAFAASARSAVQILCPGDGDWEWVAAAVESLSTREQSLYQHFKELRNNDVHSSRGETESTLELVPLSAVRRGDPNRASVYARVYQPILPGAQSPQIATRQYNFVLGGARVPAVECCAEYLVLVERLVSIRESVSEWKVSLSASDIA